MNRNSGLINKYIVKTLKPAFYVKLNMKCNYINVKMGKIYIYSGKWIDIKDSL